MSDSCLTGGADEDPRFWTRERLQQLAFEALLLLIRLLGS
jgi:hypothetical protein